MEKFVLQQEIWLNSAGLIDPYINSHFCEREAIWMPAAARLYWRTMKIVIELSSLLHEKLIYKFGESFSDKSLKGKPIAWILAMFYASMDL